MSNSTQQPEIVSSDNESYALKFLDITQIPMLDEALNSIGDYGELRLIVERGRLRFVVTQKSYDALNWQPGSLVSQD
jgi:hypothetical protein